jgi:hypothetical protein
MKIGYYEPPEQREVFDECEYYVQTIDYHSNVCKFCPVADYVVKSEKLNDKQKQIIESTIYSDDRTICLGSQTDRQKHVEEAI